VRARGGAAGAGRARAALAARIVALVRYILGLRRSVRAARDPLHAPRPCAARDAQQRAAGARPRARGAGVALTRALPRIPARPRSHVCKGKTASRHVVNAPRRAPPARPRPATQRRADPYRCSLRPRRALTRPLPLRLLTSPVSLPLRSIPTLNPWGVKLTLDTKSGGKGVVRIGCKEVGKQGLNAAVIGGKIIKPDSARPSQARCCVPCCNLPCELTPPRPRRARSRLLQRRHPRGGRRADPDQAAAGEQRLLARLGAGQVERSRVAAGFHGLRLR
jgi:hypothetical protein